MLVQHARSPDHALRETIQNLNTDHYKTASRNGDCLRFRSPVTTVWTQPWRRISWSPLRDANPFLHYIESAWMLAGRDDVKLVGTLAKNMYNYSDDGETLHGAYGFRWRRWFDTEDNPDQINTIINMLRADPATRRCVLQMWDGDIDLNMVNSGGKDVPCNTVIYFDPIDGKLNMTVSNRSNDIVWGMAGANVVHMSILHEYVAKQSNLTLGSYYQMSNNLHLYLNLDPVMQRVASYDGSTLKATINITDKDHKQEFLFEDFSMDDAAFVKRLNTMLDDFLDNKDAEYSDSDPKFIRILSVLLNAFAIYKKESARSSVLFLNQYPQFSFWLDNATEWLKRRPSYEASKS